MTILYFAWLRDRIGLSEEEIEVPDHVTTVGQLADWLASRGGNYAHAFEDREAIRVAVDQEFANDDDSITGATEVAFFPPMTGGRQ